jgi:hypothetical protein
MVEHVDYLIMGKISHEDFFNFFHVEQFKETRGRVVAKVIAEGIGYFLGF